MSTETIRETAEREAADAEREPDEQTQPEQPDAEPPERDDVIAGDAPEPEPEPPSDAAIEKAYAAIQTKATNYTKAQQQLLAETGIPWNQCPTCQVAGFVAPFDPNDPSEYERKAETDAYFGASEPDYKTAEHTETCPKCDGIGRVLSGAQNADNRLIGCPNCGALGWVMKGGTQPPAPQPATVNGEPYMATPAPTPGPEPDVWGRPPGHPHYGILPAMVGA